MDPETGSIVDVTGITLLPEVVELGGRHVLLSSMSKTHMILINKAISIVASKKSNSIASFVRRERTIEVVIPGLMTYTLSNHAT